jgi:hypothetical protein
LASLEGWKQMQCLLPSFEARKSTHLRMTVVYATTRYVMAGLDPAIHLLKKDGYADQVRV